jgi:hypothetical protein
MKRTDFRPTNSSSSIGRVSTPVNLKERLLIDSLKVREVKLQMNHYQVTENN